MRCKRFEHIPCFFSGNIFDYDSIWYILIEYRLKRVIYLGFFHITFVDGWQEQVLPLDVHVIDKALSV